MSFVDAGGIKIDAATVSRLVATQFPRWADRVVTAGPSAGAGNALFRLGDDLVVRLPRHTGAAAAVDVELRWLPWLAKQLPLAIPVPVAAGVSNELFPRPWAVFRWLRGAPLDDQKDLDPVDLALRLGQFVAALQNAESTGAPDSLRPNPLRGQGSDVGSDIRALSRAGIVEEPPATAVWESAITAPPWPVRPVWIHADLIPMNLLADRGRLCAVIDFDLMGAGDPAIDMLPAWALLTPATRALFRAESGVDESTWIRGRGYALSAALGAIRKYRGTGHPLVATGLRTLAQTIADYRQTL